MDYFRVYNSKSQEKTDFPIYYFRGDFTVKYNERIREIREDNSLSQQKVADLLHIGQRTYSDYESGKTRIPVDNLLILAKFYNVSMDYITGASKIKTEYPKE